MSEDGPEISQTRTKKRTWEEGEISEIDEEEVQQQIPEKPITTETKDLILTLIADPKINDPDKYLPLITKISALTEPQAIAYLECLTLSRNVKNHGKLSDKALSFLSNYVCHPNDQETRKLICEDETIRDGLAYAIGYLVCLFGRYAPLVLAGIYGASSWGTHYNFKKHSAKPTVQDDLLRPKSNGENNNIRENVS